MQVYRVSKNNHYVEPIIIKKGEEIPNNCVEVRPPDGLYRARWANTKWVEDMTQEEIDELNNHTKEQEIITAKRQLEETDYKIIKSSEYQLLGLEAPYNLKKLHAERQALRDNINELKNL